MHNLQNLVLHVFGPAGSLGYGTVRPKMNKEHSHTSGRLHLAMLSDEAFLPLKPLSKHKCNTDTKENSQTKRNGNLISFYKDYGGCKMVSLSLPLMNIPKCLKHFTAWDVLN